MKHKSINGYEAQPTYLPFGAKSVNHAQHEILSEKEELKSKEAVNATVHSGTSPVLGLEHGSDDYHMYAEHNRDNAGVDGVHTRDKHEMGAEHNRYNSGAVNNQGMGIEIMEIKLISEVEIIIILIPF